MELLTKVLKRIKSNDTYYYIDANVVLLENKQ